MSWWNMILETWFWSKSQSLTFQCANDHFALVNDFLGKFVIQGLELDGSKPEGPGWSFEKWEGKFWGTTAAPVQSS